MKTCTTQNREAVSEYKSIYFCISYNHDISNSQLNVKKNFAMQKKCLYYLKIFSKTYWKIQLKTDH